ncbi:MAG: aldehyde dehydrogenase family protein, partial [Rhodospirillaceae bacterium]|nr:aldehyde dehydrogenase family protein [Rhodospirillaceae bacterium]
MQLNDTNLIKNKCYVNGKWVDAGSGESFEVTNPATGSVISTVPNFGADETRAAIQAAENAYPEWRAKTAKERAVLLRNWYELIIDAADDLATLMTAEQGKPLTEARGEVVYGASFVEWFSEEAKRVYGDTIPSPA